MREETIEAYLKKQVEARGGEVRKVVWPGRRNAPDRLVMLPPRLEASTGIPTGAAWVELKRPGLAATFPKDAHERAQYREHERMRAMGQRVEVIDSKEGVDALLDSL